MYKDIVNAIARLNREADHVYGMIWDYIDYEEDTSGLDQELVAIDGEIVSLKAEAVTRTEENAVIREENYLLGYSHRI